jgi:hypothetical protein
MLLSHALRTVSPPAVVSYIGSTQNTSNLSSYTFSNVSIGTASADRIVVVGGGGPNSAAGSLVSSITIGGNTATVHTQASASQSWLASLLVPTGTTATIVVNYGNTKLNCTIFVWTITRAKSTTPNSASTAETTTSASINLNGQAGAVGCAVVFSPAGGTYTWTGLTENADLDAEGRRISSASGSIVLPTNTITATNSTTGQNTFLSGASWR